MPINCDYHLHTSFSGDSNTPMEDMIKEGIKKGLKTLCFTEHMDMDMPLPPDGSQPINFCVNTDSYLYDLLRLREKYTNDIDLKFGIEIGVQPHLQDELLSYSRSFPFDFIIASSHICNGVDPYFPFFWEGKTEEIALQEYFTSIIDCIETFPNFDVYGHLDYPVRYAPNKNANYSYAKYADYIDKILNLLIRSGKGIELNTSGLKYGLGMTHPTPDIIKRYHELGGEIITIGSDAHKPENIAYAFDQAAEILSSSDFKYYTVFEGREPSFLPIQLSQTSCLCQMNSTKKKRAMLHYIHCSFLLQITFDVN